MKKFILSLLMIAMLTGCVSEPVKQEETAITCEISSQETSVFETTTSADTSITYQNTAQGELDIVLQALIEKDESELWRIGYTIEEDDFLKK